MSGGAHRLLIGAGLPLVLMAGCPKSGTQPGADAGRAGLAANATVPDAGAALPLGVVVASRAGLRVSADDKAKMVTQLNYGERITVLEKTETFAKVRLSDGTEGYLATKLVLPGPASEATFVNEQDVYARPDALSPVKKREKRGVLMFVTADRDGWVQVNLPDKTVGWVPRDKAIADAAELTLARALYRADTLLSDKQTDAAAGLLRDALSAQPGARLGPTVEAKLAPLIPPDAGIAATTMGDGGAPIAAAGDAGAVKAVAAAPSNAPATATPDAGR